MAVAIGNAHGNYPVAPKLAFDVLEQIHDKTGIPLVLHGGSGITDADFRKAIELGIVKVNIATASFNRLTKHAEEYLKSEGAHNYFDLNLAMVQGTYENVRHHIEVFNCEMPLDEVDAKKYNNDDTINKVLLIGYMHDNRTLFLCILLENEWRKQHLLT